MDGTIVNFTTASFEKVNKLYGIKMTPEDARIPKTAQLVWERMSEEQRSKYSDHRELYGEICDKGFFANLKPFTGAVEGVKEIAEMGWEIIFLTKILNWDRSASEKATWLNKYFPDMDYKIIMVDSVHSKHLIDADVFVDDDPRVLDGVKGLSFCMSRPWNLDKQEMFYHVVYNMQDVIKLLEEVGEKLDWWESNKF